MCVSVCVCAKMDSNFSRALDFAQVQLDNSSSLVFSINENRREQYSNYTVQSGK
jgi:hypothetical protein